MKTADNPRPHKQHRNMSVAISMKRPYGYESPDRHDIDNRASKRCRSFKPSPPASVVMQHRARAKISPGSLFQPQSAHTDLQAHLPRDKRRKLAPSNLANKLYTPPHNQNTQIACATSPSCASPNEQARGANDILFTLDQVKAIVQSALAEKEVQLSKHYDAILTKRLQEQFSMFTKFNEDHIHQKMNHSQHMYMS